MIKVTDHISLRPIQLEDHAELHGLMQRVYPPAYAHYWEDQGAWYVNTIYSLENLTKELAEAGSLYYFIVFQEEKSTTGEVVGIFKIIHDYSYPPMPAFKAFKVHRVYLDAATQGKGIGKKLMQYATQIANNENHELLWLDAMETHTQAQAFYASLGFEKTEMQLLDFELLYPEHRPMWYLHKFL